MSYKSDRFLDKAQKIASIAASIAGCATAAQNLDIDSSLLSAIKQPTVLNVVMVLGAVILFLIVCNLIFRVFFAAISALRDLFSSILYKINYGGGSFNFYGGLDYHFSTGYRRYSRSPLLFTLLILAAIAFTFHMDSRDLAESETPEFSTGSEIRVTPFYSESYE